MNSGGLTSPVEILLVEDSPGEVELTVEVLQEARVLNHLSVARDGVEAMLARSIRHALERKHAEEELCRAKVVAEAASRARGRFLASMSRLTRTPMNCISGMADLLLATPLDPAQRGYAATIRSSADALLEVLDDLLDLSDIETGRLEVRAAEFHHEVILG